VAKVAVEVDSVRHGLWRNEWVVILKDGSTERYLPICIGPAQAEVIQGQLSNDCQSFPLSYYLSSVGIDTVRSELVSVTIDRFQDNAFSAKLLLSYDDKLIEIDHPPTKSIALALKEGAPVFVEERVLTEAGIRVSK
jgi:bifunctional DNase/RNase